MRFAARFVLKPEQQTCNVRGLSKPKVQYFSSGSAILGCDMSGQKWAVGALEIGKVAVAAVRVRFLPIRGRKSGCGCSAVRFFCNFGRVQEGRDLRHLGGSWEGLGRDLGALWDREEQKYPTIQRQRNVAQRSAGVAQA